MIRRISTKLLLAVLAAVVLPFVGFALFVDTQMSERLTREVVLHALKGLAADLASRVDRNLEEHVGDIALLAGRPTPKWAIREHEEARTDPAGEVQTFRPLVRQELDAEVLVKRAYDLLLLVAADGELVTSSTVRDDGTPLSPQALAALAARDYADEPWFRAALRGEGSGLDHHRSSLLPPAVPAQDQHPANYHIGFSAPVLSETEPGEVLGAVFGLVNWRHVQDEVRQPVLKEYFQGLVGEGEYPSAYAWIWADDADTIIAHDDPSLYGERVSGPRVDLPQMVHAARQADWGLYPEYTFRGKRKNAAFKRTAPPEENGFGWVVGIGIDNDDIFRAVHELRSLLFKATLVVLGLAVLLTMVIARRTTQPILALRQATQRVAAGDLDARIEVRSRDELGELASAFNRMTAELKENRARLVKVEKDAAWREMARQVAHDIKNPLTPIQLSVDLLRRAWQDGSAQFERIFERTLETITRQVAHLREIASDFHALTGLPHARPEVFDVGALLDEVLALNAAWAAELGVEVSRSGAGGLVRVDPRLLRRVLINLVSNALEAMPEGGRLEASASAEEGRVRVELRDSGTGIPEDVRARLFEPYFTTRSSGTGLGLAIARRVVEEMGGTIELVQAEPGPGTVARIQLPLHREGSGALART